ncbi:MAG: energy transducer TonB [Muribaculaceae bacterium]|nr:energy transducer TonB [Muribaculaceae bacterium]
MYRLNLLILCAAASLTAAAAQPAPEAKTDTQCKTAQCKSTRTKTTKAVADPMLDGGRVYTKVDVQAAFPGGKAALDDYVGETMVYPDYSLEHGEHGRVVVSFVIEPDGNVGYTRITESVSPDLDAEAQRIVQNMPAWTPATVKGKAVAAVYDLPINFRLPAGTKGAQGTAADAQRDVKTDAQKQPSAKMAVRKPVTLKDAKISKMKDPATFKVKGNVPVKKQ